MRGLPLVTLLAVAACGGTQPGDPCSQKAPCDNGQVCDMTAPGGPECLDAGGDLDGDGIPNDKDFCEHLAGGAFDEDGDGIGDECDACPIAPPPARPDPDGDAVDSPCDPDPRTAGDKIVLFNGFNAALPASWTATAAWKVQGGEAIMTPVTIDTVEALSAPLTQQSSHTVIFASYRIDRVAGATADAGVAGVDRLPLGTTAMTCGATRSGSIDQLRVATNASSNTRLAMNLFDPAGLYQLTEQLEGGL